LLTLPSAALVFFAVLGTTGALNYHYYGVFTLNDFRSYPFRHAYGALARIKHDA
jgi:hypothetical protein